MQKLILVIGTLIIVGVYAFLIIGALLGITLSVSHMIILALVLVVGIIISIIGHSMPNIPRG